MAASIHAATATPFYWAMGVPQTSLSTAHCSLSSAVMLLLTGNMASSALITGNGGNTSPVEQTVEHIKHMVGTIYACVYMHTLHNYITNESYTCVCVCNRS